MYMCGLITYCFKGFHFLIILIRLEFIILALFGYLIKFLIMYDSEIYFCIIFMVISVCEGSLGLSILVILIRSHGNDFLQSLNLL